MHRYLHRAATALVVGLLIGGLVLTHPFAADAAPSQQSLVVVGAGPGGSPHVRLFLANGDPTTTSFYAYGANFHGGVDVALADLDGDGTQEIVTGAGPGGAPHVRVFRLDGTPIDKWSFYAYAPGFTGGVHVGVSDVDGDGDQEIVTGAGPGGAPHVKVFELSNDAPTAIRSFYAYSPSFTGGVYATGMYADDETDNQSIVTGAGPGGAPHVLVYNPATTATTASFYAYAPGFTGGVNVDAIDLNEAAGDAIITGPGAGGGPHVRAFSAAGVPETGFFAYAQGFTGGVDVGAFYGNNESINEAILTAPMGGTAPILSFGDEGDPGAFNGLTPQPFPGFTGGIHIAGGFSLFDPANPSGTTTTTSTSTSSTSTSSSTTSTTLTVNIS